MLVSSQWIPKIQSQVSTLFRIRPLKHIPAHVLFELGFWGEKKRFNNKPVLGPICTCIVSLVFALLLFKWPDLKKSKHCIVYLFLGGGSNASCILFSFQPRVHFYLTSSLHSDMERRLEKVDIQEDLMLTRIWDSSWLVIVLYSLCLWWQPYVEWSRRAPKKEAVTPAGSQIKKQS